MTRRWITSLETATTARQNGRELNSTGRPAVGASRLNMKEEATRGLPTDRGHGTQVMSSSLSTILGTQEQGITTARGLRTWT